MEKNVTIEQYMPDFVLEKAYDVTVAGLKKHGIKVVFVDLDNTLIAWNNPDGTPEMRQWLQDLQEAQIPVVVVSNNKYERVKRAVAPFGVDFESYALKPFTFGMERALKRFDVKREEVVMIGDQLMTDIRAAKRAGLRSVLVRPLLQSDSINTQFNRWRERRMLKKMAAKYGPLDYKREM